MRYCESVCPNGPSDADVAHSEHLLESLSGALSRRTVSIATGPSAPNFMLRSLLQLAAAFALAALGVSTAVLARDAHRISLDADKTLRDVDAAVISERQDLLTSELELNTVLLHLDGTISQLDTATQEQRAYWQKTSADSDKTVKALRLTVDRASLLLDHTDKQLNGVLLPDFDRQLSLTSDSAQLAFGSITHAGDALTFDINDLQPVFANLQETSAQFASASGHADKILGSGERTAKYYEVKLTTPATFAHKLAMGVLDVGSKAGNIMAGFVK